MPASADTCLWFELPHAPAAGTVVAHLDSLPRESATMVALGPADETAQAAFRLLHLRSGSQVRAFVNRCPHFGVPLAARQELLIQKPGISISCNVHYARFRWADGLCESGECLGESLIPVPLEVRMDGSICILSPSLPESSS